MKALLPQKEDESNRAVEEATEAIQEDVARILEMKDAEIKEIKDCADYLTDDCSPHELRIENYKAENADLKTNSRRSSAI